jgi:hypothetical protein
VDGACLEKQATVKCSGAFPANAKWWGDGYWYSQGSKSANYQAGNKTTEDCDYYCAGGYEYKNGACAKKAATTAKCNGNLPTNSKWWVDATWRGNGSKSINYQATNNTGEDCDYYCKSGYEYRNNQCLKPTTSSETCTDPDGGSIGDALYKQTTATYTKSGGRSIYTDKCLLRVKKTTAQGGTYYQYNTVASCSGAYCALQEAYCDNNKLSNIRRECANGCKNGACVKTAVKGVKIKK